MLVPLNDPIPTRISELTNGHDETHEHPANGTAPIPSQTLAQSHSWQPMDLLPAELLEHIFFLTHYDKPFTHLSQLRLSHVCRRWRGVALASPRLWTHIPVEKRDTALVALFLARANGHPLELTVTDFDDMDDAHPYIPSHDETRYLAMLPFLFEHLPRTRSFKLGIDTSGRMGLLKALSDVPAPLLEHLSLEFDSSLIPLFLEGALVRLFGEEAPPRLRHAILKTVPLPWGSNLLKGGELRYLTIHNQLTPRFDVVLDILRANPHLIELELYHFSAQRLAVTSPRFKLSSPSTTEGEEELEARRKTADYSTVSLPHLRKIWLGNTDLDIPAFLAHLRSPTDIFIDQFVPDRARLQQLGLDRVFPSSEVATTDEEFLLSDPITPLCDSQIDAFRGEEITAMKYTNYAHDVWLAYHRLPPTSDTADTDADVTPLPEENRARVVFSFSGLTRNFRKDVHFFASIGGEGGVPLPNLRLLHLYGIPAWTAPTVASAATTPPSLSSSSSSSSSASASSSPPSSDPESPAPKPLSRAAAARLSQQRLPQWHLNGVHPSIWDSVLSRVGSESSSLRTLVLENCALKEPLGSLSEMCADGYRCPHLSTLILTVSRAEGAAADLLHLKPPALEPLLAFLTKRVVRTDADADLKSSKSLRTLILRVNSAEMRPPPNASRLEDAVRRLDDRLASLGGRPLVPLPVLPATPTPRKSDSSLNLNRSWEWSFGA